MRSLNLDGNRSRTLWIGFGVVLVGAFLWIVYSFIGTVVFGLFIYYATREPFKLVLKRINKRWVAAAVTLLLGALPVVLLLTYATAVALQDLNRVATGMNLEPYLAVVDPYLDAQFLEDPVGFVQETPVLEVLQTSLDQAYSYIGLLGNGLLHLFVMFALAYYLHKDGDRLRASVRRYDDHYPVLASYGRAVDKNLEYIFAGNIANAFATGIIGAVTYTVLNVFAPASVSVPAAALVGLLAGLASLVPIVGMKLVYVPASGFLAYRAFLAGGGWWFVGAFVVVSVVVVDLIPDLFIRPRVSRSGWSGLNPRAGDNSSGESPDTDATGDGDDGRPERGSDHEHGELHVGALMLAYIFGPLLFGWYGIFLGPIVLVLLYQFVRLVVPELLAGEEIEPTVRGTPPESSTGGQSEPTGGEDPAEGGSGAGADEFEGDGEGRAGGGEGGGDR